MGCLFTKVKEPIDGIYLDVHELKEVPILAEQPTSSLKKRCTTPQNLDIVPPSTDIQDHSFKKSESAVPHDEPSNPPYAEKVTSYLGSQNPKMVPRDKFPDEDDDSVSELDSMPRRSCSENFSNGCKIATKKLSADAKLGDQEKLSRKCSFGIETKIIEFNPKKCINIYRLDNGNIRDEDDLSYFEVSLEEEQGSTYTEVNANDDPSVHLSESLAFQNANFVDSQAEKTIRNNESSNLSSTFPKTYKIQQTPNVYSTVSHQAYSGAKRAISNRKSPANIWDSYSQKSGNTTNITQQQSRITQSATEGANALDSHLRQGGAYVYSKGRQNSFDRNLAPDNQYSGSSDEQPVIVYHTKRRISTISITSNDKEELNALDGVTRLQPHPGSSSDRRNSTTFDHSVRRLSSNLVGFFHS